MGSHLMKVSLGIFILLVPLLVSPNSTNVHVHLYGFHNLEGGSGKSAQESESDNQELGLSDSIGCLDTSRYLPLNELYHCLQNLARAAPNSVKLESIGNTHIEGKSFQNEVYLVTIGNENEWSREWISPATCLYLIKQLTL